MRREEYDEVIVRRRVSRLGDSVGVQMTEDSIKVVAPLRCEEGGMGKELFAAQSPASGTLSVVR